jgi:hypothetical protein
VTLATHDAIRHEAWGHIREIAARTEQAYREGLGPGELADTLSHIARLGDTLLTLLDESYDFQHPIEPLTPLDQ